MSQFVELPGVSPGRRLVQGPITPNLETSRQSGGIRLLAVVSDTSLTGHKLLVGE